MFLIKLLANLPLPVLYVISDIMSFLNVYLIAYKKEVIKKNLFISFPDMSDKEKEKVMYGFTKT
ncbi:MAG: hypothetical protein IIB82_08020 [Bacteroidetes bacterium]|nr:hypothetical protein [Bacteroidota bacterium]